MNAISKVSPWTAKPLTEAAKNAKFRSVMDLSVERVILGRSAIVTGWVIGATGLALFSASIIGWVAILPLKTVEYRFELIDKSTGIVSVPVGLEDAPTLFGEATAEQYLRRYIEAREDWIPEMDQENDHVAKVMSSPDEQARINAERAKPTSNVNAIGKKGHVMVDNFRYHPLAIDRNSQTIRYLVQFDRTVWNGGTADKPVPWSATVDFQWHPSLPMKPDDRTINVPGFQAINYSHSSDTPDQHRE
jgi:type IV secretory pathway component VirB8